MAQLLAVVDAVVALEQSVGPLGRRGQPQTPVLQVQARLQGLGQIRLRTTNQQSVDQPFLLQQLLQGRKRHKSIPWRLGRGIEAEPAAQVILQQDSIHLQRQGSSRGIALAHQALIWDIG